jgi:uncharacterized protein (TIGR02996 family)
MSQEQQQGLMQAIARAPYDAQLRLVFADWLEENGLEAEAMHQRWLNKLLAGAPRYDLVVTRQGIHAPSSRLASTLRKHIRDYWLSVAAELFAKNADAVIVLIDDLALTKCGLRKAGPAPSGKPPLGASDVVFYRKNWKPPGGARNLLYFRGELLPFRWPADSPAGRTCCRR